VTAVGLPTSPAPFTPEAALADPGAAAAAINARCPGVTVTAAVGCDQGRRPVALLSIVIDPPQQLAEHGYPTEGVAVVLDGEVRVFPAGDSARQGRAFGHRNPTGEYCLFYARDDPALTWRPEDGLEELLAITQRHVAAEEYVRRHGGAWPVEDAPHGEPAVGTHPIRSRAARRAAREGTRNR
jgi:hypothetical protein